jgi:hypothetical protein
MFALALAFAYALAIFSLFASVVVVAHGVKIKAAIPTLGGVVYFASAIAVLGAISA